MAYFGQNQAIFTTVDLMYLTKRGADRFSKATTNSWWGLKSTADAPESPFPWVPKAYECSPKHLSVYREAEISAPLLQLSVIPYRAPFSECVWAFLTYPNSFERNTRNGPPPANCLRSPSEFTMQAGRLGTAPPEWAAAVRPMATSRKQYYFLWIFFLGGD